MGKCGRDDDDEDGPKRFAVGRTLAETLSECSAMACYFG